MQRDRSLEAADFTGETSDLRCGDGDKMHAPFREGSGLCQAGHELTWASRRITMAESEQDGRITVAESE